MIVLQMSDLLALIETDVLDDITGSDSTIIDTAELSAIGEVTGYLSIRYDATKALDKGYITASVLAPTHDAFNGVSTVIEKLADITLYNLHTRVMPDNVPTLRQKRYDNAISWLEKVAQGFIAPSLPVKEVDPTTPLRYGNSQPTQNPYY